MSFSDWYDLYPKKVAMGAASRAYNNAIFFNNIEESVLLEGLKAYKAVHSDTETKYWPRPDAWLNDKRWLDEDVQKQLNRREVKTEVVDFNDFEGDWADYRKYLESVE